MNSRRVGSLAIVALFIFGFVLIARADDHCLKGRDALARGDFQTAISELRDGVQDDKKNVECLINLGDAYLHADSLDQAISCFVQAKALDSNNVKIYIMLGDVYARQAIHTAAVDQYAFASHLDSTKPQIYKKMAASYKQLRDYNAEATALLHAAVLDTTDIDVYRELGLLYNRSKLYEKACQFLKYVYDHNPKDSSRIGFAHALYEAKHYREFLPVAEAIISSDGSQKTLLGDMALAYKWTGDTAKARSFFLQTDTTGFKSKDWLERADGMRPLGMTDEAIDAYHKALQDDSALGPKIYYNLGTLYMKKGDYEGSVQMFDKMIAADTSTNFRFASNLNASICLMRLKDYGRARQYALNAIGAKPDYVPSWQYLARCYGQLDSNAEARSAYVKMVGLIEASPDPAKFKDEAAEGYRMIGFYDLLSKKYQSAIEYLKKALVITSNDCQTLLWTAQAYALSNLREDAKRYYCKVIATCGRGETSKLAADAQKGLATMGAECK